MQHVQHTFFCLFSELLNNAACEKKYLLLQSLQAMTEGEHHAKWNQLMFSKLLTPKKKMHAKRPIWSTIWSTKSCMPKDPSGARFGAQKVAREKTHLKHDLKHKKLHAKRTDLEHDLKHKKLEKKHSKNPLFWKIKLCSVQFWWESKIVGNTHDQFFKLSIANCVEWLQWARRAGTVKKKTLQTNHEAPE